MIISEAPKLDRRLIKSNARPALLSGTNGGAGWMRLRQALVAYLTGNRQCSMYWTVMAALLPLSPLKFPVGTCEATGIPSLEMPSLSALCTMPADFTLAQKTRGRETRASPCRSERPLMIVVRRACSIPQNLRARPQTRIPTRHLPFHTFPMEMMQLLPVQ